MLPLIISFLLPTSAALEPCLTHIIKAQSLEAHRDDRGALGVYFRALACNPNVIEAQFTDELMPFQPPTPLDASRAWKHGERLRHKSLLVYAVKGHGDSLQFVRFVKLLSRTGVREVTLVVPPSLRDLFAHSLRDLKWLSVRATAELPALATSHDRHATMVSLPYLLDIKSPDPAPYLEVPPDRTTGDLVATDRPTIGVILSGDTNHPHNKDRSFTVADLAPLKDLANVKFYSLQPGFESGRDQTLSIDGSLLTKLTDYAATAAVIKRLDLVISADTSVSHLAAALGRPTLVPLARRTDLRYAGVGRTTPWYRDMMLFRQTVAGDWSGPMVEIKAEVMRRLKLSSPSR